MPIIHNGTYYIYHQNAKNRQKYRKFLPIFAFFGIIFVIIAVFYAFTKFDFVSVFNMNKYLIFDAKTYYAVSICSGNREEVSSYQQAAKANGAAGYIYQTNQKFCLLANIYKSFNDAHSVVQKLTEYQAEIVELKLDKLILSAEYSAEQLSALKYVLNEVNRAVDAISEIVISFDRGEILEGEAKQKMQVFANSCQQDKEMLTSAFQYCCDGIVTYAKIFCNQTATNVMSANISTNFSSDAKRLMIDIVTNFVDLQKNVKK